MGDIKIKISSNPPEICLESDASLPPPTQSSGSDDSQYVSLSPQFKSIQNPPVFTAGLLGFAARAIVNHIATEMAVDHSALNAMKDLLRAEEASPGVAGPDNQVAVPVKILRARGSLPAELSNQLSVDFMAEDPARVLRWLANNGYALHAKGLKGFEFVRNARP